MGGSALKVGNHRVDDGHLIISGSLPELDILRSERAWRIALVTQGRNPLLDTAVGEREASTDPGRGRQLPSGQAKEGDGMVAMFL